MDVTHGKQSREAKSRGKTPSLHLHRRWDRWSNFGMGITSRRFWWMHWNGCLTSGYWATLVSSVLHRLSSPFLPLTPPVVDSAGICFFSLAEHLLSQWMRRQQILHWNGASFAVSLISGYDGFPRSPVPKRSWAYYLRNVQLYRRPILWPAGMCGWTGAGEGRQCHWHCQHLDGCRSKRTAE